MRAETIAEHVREVTLDSGESALIIDGRYVTSEEAETITSRLWNEMLEIFYGRNIQGG